jgi:signal transduction histidine kinase
MGLLAWASIQRSLENTNPREKKLLMGAIGTLAVIYFICSYKMVLSYQFPAGYNRPTLNYFTSYTYGVLQSFAMGGLLVAGLRTEGTWEFLVWFLFVSMNGSDFALRLQDVGKLPLGTPVFEYGWELAVAGLSSLALYRKLKPSMPHTGLFSRPTPLASIRVLIPLATLGILVLFVSLNLLIAPYFHIANIDTISGHALTFAFAWVAANCIGIGLSHLLSERIAQLNEKITSAMSLSDIGDISGNLIELNPVIASLKQLKGQLSVSMEENVKMLEAVAASSAAAGVAHNIRSPLSSLEMGIQLIPNIPDSAAGIIKQALSEMRGIVQGYTENREKRKVVALASSVAAQRKVPVASEGLAELLEGSIGQKRLEYKGRSNVEIDFESDASSRSIFSNVNRVEFSVVISNLINNAVEAIPLDHEGIIRVTLSKENEYAVIRVVDNGKGISPEDLPILGSPGVSIGKPQGTGYGLFHAKSTLQQWRGSLAISSTPNQGSEITLKLPLIDPPSWFVSHIEIPENGLVCIIDDDASIHAAWSVKLERVGINQASILHFYDPASFRAWCLECRDQREGNPITYIVDYEFKGTPENGLDLIEAARIAESSVLVTGHAAEPTVIHRCQWLGIKLVAKADISVLPLSHQEPLSGLTHKIELKEIELDTGSTTVE